MAFFECGYAGANGDRVRLCADLAGGWRKLTKGWGFYADDYLNYRGESKFHCKLYLVEKAPSSYESRKMFHERYLLSPLRLGSNFVMLHGMKLEVEVPLDQGWKRTNDINRRPCVHEIGEDIFSVDTDDGAISYRIQIWVVLHGQSKMFVPDQREWGDGFAWIGGRPESNPRKF
jgi:hypothetical protein